MKIQYAMSLNQTELEWGCPNGTKYPPRQPIQTPQVMRLKLFYLTERTRLQTDRRTDRVIPVYPLTSLRGYNDNYGWSTVFSLL